MMVLLRHLPDILLSGASRLLNVDHVAFLFPRSWLLLWAFAFLVPWAIRAFIHHLKTARIMEARPPRLRLFFSMVSLLAMLFFLIVTLAEPYSVIVVQMPVYKDEILDFSIDNSLSQQATDIAPSRMAKVKSELIGAIQRLNQEGISTLCLGAFTVAYERLLECTQDVANFENYARNLNISSAPDKGTDLLAALPNDYDLMRKDVIPPKARITLFVITDGGMGICRDKQTNQLRVLKPDWNEENLREAIFKFRKDNIRVIPIGVGGKKPVEVYVPDYEGRSVAVTVSGCESLYTVLDEKIIEKIAEWSGDKNRKFFLQRDTSLGDFIEKTVLTSREVSSYVPQEKRKELWRYSLVAAIILGLIGSGTLRWTQRILRLFSRRK